MSPRNTRVAPVAAPKNEWQLKEHRNEETGDLFAAELWFGEQVEGKFFRANTFTQAKAAFSAAARGVRGELDGAKVGFHPYSEKGYMTEWGLRPNGLLGVISSEYEGTDFPKPEDEEWHYLTLGKRGVRLDPKPVLDKIADKYGGFYHREFHDAIDYMLNGWTIYVGIGPQLRPWAERVLENNEAQATGNEELIAEFRSQYGQAVNRRRSVVSTKSYVAKNGHAEKAPVVLAVDGTELDLNGITEAVNIEILDAKGDLVYVTRHIPGSQFSNDILAGEARKGRRFVVVQK